MLQLRRERETEAEEPERGGWKRAKLQAEERTREEKPVVASFPSASRGKTSLGALLSHKVKEETHDKAEEEQASANRKSRKVKSGDEDSIAFELSNKRRVTVRKWRGTLYVDIREFYDDNGTSKPGKKGISLSCDQWGTLCRLFGAVDEAIRVVEDDDVEQQSLDHVKERLTADTKDRSIAFALAAKRRLTVRFFRTSVLIDLREYYDQNGVVKPGKKGISLSKEQWSVLKQLKQEISDAREQL